MKTGGALLDIYHMTPEETVGMIKQLKVEVRWSKFELLNLIRGCANSYKRMGLEKTLNDLAKRPALLQEIWWKLVNKAPFRIKLDNLDDREGCVMITAESVILAIHDQSIAGSNWEISDGLAYAMPADHPSLLAEIKQEGYEVDDTEYCPP